MELKNSFIITNANYYIICDNATIHKSMQINEFLVANNIRMVAIYIFEY